MSELVREIVSEADFDSVTATGVVLVDFFATWCGPCKMLAPILDQMAAEFDGKASIVKVDVDKNQSLAAKFNVESIPTLVLFKGGQVFDRLVGLQQADALKKALSNATG